MKRMKKIVSLALALIMAFAMTTTAFAADNHVHVITVTGNEDDKGTHTYEAYQIFAGDLADNPEYKKLTCETDHKHSDKCYTVDSSVPQYILSNIVWGSGVDGVGLLTALKTSGVNDSEAITAFKVKYAAELIKCETAADVADFISDFSSSTANKSDDIDVFASIVSEHLTTDYYMNGNGADGDANKIHVNGSGYYFIKDMDASLADQEEAAYTRFLLQVVGDATVVVKSEVPSGDKQVYVDGVTDDNLGDANNASIGSHVSYKITSKVPNHVGYNYYYFIMNDTLSEGLTFDGAGSVAVKVGNQELSQGIDYYVYTENVGSHTFRLAFTNIMNYAVGADIAVTYSATINDKAVVGTTGNPNTWNLQYSNNPDKTFDGERPDGENTPGLPADEENEALGQTPDEKTLTYVTELDITKYANSVAEDHLLAGAEFTLTGTSKQVVLNAVDYYEASEEGTYYLMLDGTYTETAPTGTEYVEIGVGTKDTTTGYIKDGDNYVVPTDKTQYEGATLYKLVKGTAEKYADVNTKYEKKTAEETIYVDADVSIELTTGADGKIYFKDLGAGTYTLTETVTPAGFNTIDQITFEITFQGPDRGVVTGEETCIWDIAVIDGDFEVSEGGNDNSLGGVFSANIINQSGSLLPSTGGIGTTIFYVIGGILVIGAGILLVAKKRMSNR